MLLALLHLVLLDTSASLLKQQLLAQAKAVVVAIAQQAYLKREQLAILGFGNQQVAVLLPQQKAPKYLSTYLQRIMALGGTPLRKVLQQARQFQQRHYRKYPESSMHTYLLTDGRTTQTVADVSLLSHSVVIDLEQSPIKRGRCQVIAQTLGADYFPLDG